MRVSGWDQGSTTTTATISTTTPACRLAIHILITTRPPLFGNISRVLHLISFVVVLSGSSHRRGSRESSFVVRNQLLLHHLGCFGAGFGFYTWGWELGGWVFFDIPASKFALCSFLGEEEEEEGNAKTEEGEEEEEVSVTYISAVFFTTINCHIEFRGPEPE